jgi:Flp pilus assembly protein CpaB
MTYRLRNIVLAVVLAVLAALLTALYVANYQNRVDAGQELVKVFVAKSDIPPGTAAAAVQQLVSQKEVQQRSVAPAAVYDFQTLKGQTTAQWIYTGEQVSARRFNSTGRTGIHAELKGNFRAFSVPGTKQQLLAGVLKAGDHVDVIAHFGPKLAARTLLRDVLVLRAPQSGKIDSSVATSQDNAFDVVLRVTDSQANKLFFVTSGVVDDEFDWWLGLRAPVDATDSPESLTTLPSAIRDGLPANWLQQAMTLDTEGDK